MTQVLSQTYAMSGKDLIYEGDVSQPHFLIKEFAKD